MTEKATLDDFATHAFSEALSEPHRLRLASGARPFSASPGEYLARAGEPAHAFYLIQSGYVEHRKPSRRTRHRADPDSGVRRCGRLVVAVAAL